MNMKTIREQISLLSSIFIMLIFFQSCRVYHSKHVPLEEAVKSEKRVKIKTKEQKTLKFNRVVLEEGQFYGIKVKGKQINKTLLKIEDLKKVRLHNKTMSIILGIAVPVITIAGIFVIAISSWSGPDIGGDFTFPN